MMENKKPAIVLYGASVAGQIALNDFGKENVRYFCDGDKNKVGMFIDGVEVIGKEQLISIKDEVEIVITSHKYKTIIKELNKVGIFKYQLYEFKYSLYFSEEYIRLKNSVRSLFVQDSQEKLVCSEDTVLSLLSQKEGPKFVFAFGVSCSEWMVVESLYKAAAKNAHCYCVVMDRGLDKLKVKGLEVYYADEYRIEEDRPDVVIYADDWQGKAIDPKKAKQYAKKLVMIPVDMVIYQYDWSTRLQEVAKRYLRQNADMCFVNPDFYQKFKPYQNNLIVEGNPKLDYIYEKLTEDMTIPTEWKKKIGSKKVIMWATAHGLDDRIIAPIYTFDIWAKDVIEYFQKHREYVLLFRSSGKLFDDLIASKICTYNECKRFEELFESEENFILDTTPDYGLAYNISDALLCPPNGMLMSYLPTKKPIVYTATYRMDYSFTDKALIENYYIAKDKTELAKHIDKIFNQNDPLYEKRMHTLKKYIPHFDGKIGERIMKRILDLL